MALTIQSAVLEKNVFTLGEENFLTLMVQANESDVTDMQARLCVNYTLEVENGEPFTGRFALCNVLYIGEVIPADGSIRVFEQGFTVRAETIDPFQLEILKQRKLDVFLEVVYADGSGAGLTAQYELSATLLDRFRRPKIDFFSAVRYANGMAADDSDRLLVNLRLSLADSADTDGFGLTLDWGESLDLSASVPDAVSGIVNSEDYISRRFSADREWTLTLTFSDGAESDSRTVTLPKAFANLHLSGRANGGACFGGFSTSEDDAPKLESHYPAYFYGGIHGVNNYSLGEEIETGGRWIDGKPIYRRVWQVTTTARVQKNVAENLDYETIVRMDGYGRVTTMEGRWYPLNFLTAGSLVNRLMVDSGTLSVYSLYASECFIVLEYTKAG